MSEMLMSVQGTVRPDGQLDLDQPLRMPAGRVQVTVQPLPPPPETDRFWKMMESIWTDLKADGRHSRSREEIDAEIAALRNDAEEEMLAVERLHDQCRSLRDESGHKEEPSN